MNPLQFRVGEGPWPKIRKAAYLISFNIGLLLICLPLLSQSNAGRISGTITDQTGGVIAGATVTIADTERSFSRTLITNEAGEYTAPDLIPSTYAVRAEAQGFNSLERSRLVLEVGAELRIDLTLQPGDQTQTVTVTERLPLIETSNVTLGGTLSNQTINDLPLNGRNYENLLGLRPGVTRLPGGGSSSTVSNGMRPDHNVYIVDGIDEMEIFSGNSIINSPGLVGDAATILPIDAIQEFNIKENPNAEFGWKPGAVVDVGLKSGTNSLHGTAYAFGRDSALDATNPFITSSNPKQAVTLEQFGGTLGGRLKKDKVFYFIGYEGQRYTLGSTLAVTVPTSFSFNTTTNSVGDPTHSIPDALADMAKHSVAESPLSAKLVGDNIFQSGNTPVIIDSFPNIMQSDNGIAKLDYKVNERHALSAEYFGGNNQGEVTNGTIVQPYWQTSVHARAQVAGTSWTWIAGSNWVNQARFGFTRFYQPWFPSDCNIGYGINTGAQSCGFPTVNITGFSALGCCNGFPKIVGPDQTFQYIDDASYAHGKHALKFGGEVRYGIFNGGIFNAGKGSITFGTRSVNAFPGATPLEDFLAGAPSQGSILVGNPTVRVTNWNYAGFVQDEWRVTRTLTLNAGVRYEYATPIKEAHNLLGNFDPNVGLVQVGKQVGEVYRGDPNNFAPRVGIAWDVTGKGKTVVRVGAGITYITVALDAFLAQQDPTAATPGLNTVPTGASGVQPGGGTIAVGTIVLNSSAGTPPTTPLNWTLAGPVFPTGKINCSPPNPCPTFAVNSNLRTPYVGAWDLNIQHAFTNDLSLQVGYIGNHAAKLVGLLDLNAPLPGVSGAAAEQLRRPFSSQFPFLANINYLTNLDESNYNAMQLTLTQRSYHGLSFVAGYTWSHALDDAFQDFANVPMDSLDPRLEYGNSTSDVRNRFTFSATYAVPGKKTFGQMLEGWQLSSIVNLQSGRPWSVMDRSTDISGTGEFTDRWDFFGNPGDFASGPSPIPFFKSGKPPASDPNGSGDPAYAVNNPTCVAKARSFASLQSFGCYQKGSSVMAPPAAGTFGTMGRNIFPGPNFRNWDLSVMKNWRLMERLSAQFRAEFFNVLNHPMYGFPSPGAFRQGPTSPNTFGCACATPDNAANNPVIGSGSARAIQLGLKLIF